MNSISDNGDFEVIDFALHSNQVSGVSIYFNTASNLITSKHGHDFYEIFYIPQGTVLHEYNGVFRPLSAGTLFYLRPDDIHRFIEPSSDFTLYNIAFSQHLASTLFSLMEGNAADLFIQKGKTIQRILRTHEADVLEIILTRNIESLDTRSKSFWGVELVIHMFRLFADSVPHEEHYPEWLADLLVELEHKNNFLQGLDYLFDHAYRSKEHVSRSFRKYLGLSPTDYLNQKKLEYAANLLERTNIELIEISDKAGFNSHSHFYHLFKKKYGKSPRKYRLEVDYKLI